MSMMPPPGRRKGLSMQFLALLVLLVFTIGASAAPAALGIDFGTEYIKAAIAKPGSPIEIVLTKDSKRKEAASLAFKPSRAQSNDDQAYPERLYGGDALAVAARYPADVYPNLKPLLGVSPTDDVARAYVNRFPGLQMQPFPRENDAQSVGFTSKNLGKSDPLMIEELVAMELQNIKANAEAMVGKNNFVADVVITYPSFYTAQERRALELAADLAGLRVLALISDGQAIGLNYATTRAFDSKSKDIKPEYHLIYDMGAGSTTATVLKFYGKTVKAPGKKNQTIQEVQVLGHGNDRGLGGDLLNDLIVDDMLKKFLATDKAQALGLTANKVHKDGKTRARLWKDAEKVRQVLSANQQASTSLEGLFHEDANFKYALTRSDFEELAQPYIDRVAGPILQALERADMHLSDMASVILHGGMTRTPFVQTQLEKTAGASKIKTNINADEAAAFGAAFKAAGLSPSFRVKDIRTSDIAGSDYIMKWTADNKERTQKIFVETSALGAEKTVTIKSTEDVQIDFLQPVGNDLELQPVLSVEAANLTRSSNELRNSYGCANSNVTTTFTIRLSPFDGLPEILSGSVSCQAVKEKEGSVMDNVKGMFGFGSKKDGEQQPIQDNDETAETPLPVDDPTSSGSIISEATATASDASPTGKAASTKPSTVVIPLSLKSTPTGPGAPPRKALPLVKQRLSAFDISDRNAYLRSEALNVLEAFTYRARDYLEDEKFATFSTDKTRKELQTQLSQISDWLYGDGADARTQEFKDKLKTLQNLVDPVLKRKEESTKRDQAIETLRNSLSNAASMIDMIKGFLKKATQEASSSASSVVSAASEAASPVNRDDDLEDEPYASATGAASADTEPAPPKTYEYTTEDLNGIEKAYDSVKGWLDEKVAAQEKLKLSDDPAVLVAELEAKAKQVGSAVTDVVMKQIKIQTPPKSKKSKTSKKPKKSKSSTASGTDESRAEATATVKDEL